MEIKGRKVLLLGGSGLCGMAVVREMAAYDPALIVITGLTQHEAEGAVAEIKEEAIFGDDTRIEAEWGDMFVPVSLKDKTRREILESGGARGELIDDLFGELTGDVVK